MSSKEESLQSWPGLIAYFQQKSADIDRYRAEFLSTLRTLESSGSPEAIAEHQEWCAGYRPHLSAAIADLEECRCVFIKTYRQNPILATYLKLLQCQAKLEKLEAVVNKQIKPLDTSS